MSKRADQPPKEEEEEWEDVEEGEEGEEEEEDSTINNSDVVVKYKRAAQWANEVLTVLVATAAPNVTVGSLCAKGDELIAAKVATMFKGVSKGAAFPTSISVNNCVCHNSPSEHDDPKAFGQVLQLNDVVRIDLGVQVDGYAAVVAHTVLLTASEKNAQLPPDSKEANVIAAASAALNIAIRGFRPEYTLYQITDVLERVSALYGVTPVEGVLSHEMKRYIVDGAKVIAEKNTPEHKVHDYSFTPASVWTLDVVFSTGKGKLKTGDQKTSIFKACLETEYSTKLGAAEELQKEIDTKFETFPFAVRNCSANPGKVRLALAEMLRHQVVQPYPVLYEKAGEAVAHFKVTLLITNSKIERITGIAPQKVTAAPVSIDKDEFLVATSKLPMAFVKKEKAEKPAAEAAKK